MTAAGASATAQGNVPVEQRIRAVAAIKAHVLHQAVAYASQDGEVPLVTANALEAFPNLATTMAYVRRLAIAHVLKGICHSIVVLSAKVARVIPVTDTAPVSPMALVIVMPNTGDVRAT